METGNSAGMAEIQRLRNTAWEAIGSATVGKSERNRYWKAWTKHCRLYKASSSGEPPPDTPNMLLTFAVAVREGQYGVGHQVQVQSVSKALRAVAQKYVLDGYPDPRKSSPAQHSLDLPLARLLKKYKDEDPPAEPKLECQYPQSEKFANIISCQTTTEQWRICAPSHSSTSYE